MSELPDRFAHLSPLKRALLAIDELQVRLDAAEGALREPIAVIGMSCRLPGADSPEALWDLLREGRSAVGPMPADRFDVEGLYDPDPATPGKMSTRWGAFLPELDCFDAAFFGIAPREAATMDPQQRLLLETAWRALEDAGQPPDRLSGSRTGVYVGVCGSDYADLLRRRDRSTIDGHLASGIAHSIVSGRLSYLLGLQGPAISIDTACSSSLVALHLACQSLRTAECTMAVAGGVNVVLTPDNTVSFSKSGMMAADGRCKTFDAAADGFVRGEGCVVLVLKRLKDALAADDRVHAVIRATALNQDGPSGSLTAPNGVAQEALIREAVASAGIDPLDVSYVEAHGTGTELGDPIEVQALARALADGRPASRPLRIGSLKTNMGHLEATAGVAGLLKVILSLQHRQIPPHLNFEKPSPHIDWASAAIDVPTRLVPWDVEGRRIAGVSSFGFSGTNAHVIVEEAPSAPPRTSARTVHALAVSARSGAALDRRLRDLQTHLASVGDAELADLCFTANARRAHHPHRLAIVTRSANELAEQLDAAVEGRPAAGVIRRAGRSIDPPRLALLFTGQGAQYPGMGASLYETQPTYRAAFDRAADAMRAALAADLRDVVFGDGDAIDRTGWTQPALFAVEYALAELWQAWGVRPAAVLGHSVGELVAAAVSGVLSVEDAARLAARRGALMQALPPGGAMAAVFADESRVLREIGHYRGRLAVAAINAPESVVISGDAAALTAALDALQREGVRGARLPVSHAFHSALLDPMLDDLEREAASMTHHRPRMPIVSNVTGAIAPAGLYTPSYWRRHAREAVRFADGIQALRAAGCTIFLECGPRPTLVGLGQQCLPDSDLCWLPSLREHHDDWTQMTTAVAELYAAGADIDWTGVYRGDAGHVVTLPAYPFERERHWTSVPDGASARSAARGGHPLIGSRLSSPALDAVVFEGPGEPDAPGYLVEHRVLDQPIMPATGFVEMALAAARQIDGTAPAALSDMVVREPMRLDADGWRTHVVIRTESPGRRRFEIYSQAEPATADAPWTLHAEGMLGDGALDEAAHAPCLDEVRARCRTATRVDDFYEGMSRRGLQFGPAFRGLRELWRGRDEALGLAALDVSRESEARRYVVHPSLLDACVQVLGEAVAERAGDDDLYLPVGLGRVRIDARAATTLWAHAELREADTQGTLAARIRLFARDGRPAGVIDGLTLRKATRKDLQRPRGERIDDWLYEVRWEPADGDGDVQPGAASPAAIRSALAGRRAREREEPGLDAYDDLLPRLDALSRAYVLDALASMGVTLVPGAYLPHDLASRLGIVQSQGRLFGRLLEMLEEDGVVERSAGGWRVVRAPSASERGTRPRPASESANAVELAIVERCGSRLADVLTGRCDPLELLFPNGSQSIVERLYQDPPMARAFNGLLRDAVGEALGDSPPGRRLRVLEIGGGTASTTRFVLPALPLSRTDYVFTDVSPLFVARAAERFDDTPSFSAQVLDIERDPRAQGLEPSSFDVVIAANVIHATRDLQQTLTHVRDLLKPGGLLVMLEVTRPQRWLDVSFGMTDGWWRFNDPPWRTSNPLLPPASWEAVLTNSGFDDVAILPDRRGNRAWEMQSVLLARRAVERSIDAGAWLVLNDTAGIAGRAVRLVAGDAPVIAVAAGDVDSADERAIARLVVDAGPIAGVVYGWGLDVGNGEATDALDALTVPCRGLLHVVQALQRIEGRRTTRLWVATRGAQAVDAASVTAPAAATLWGLGQVVSLEHPELGCVCVDLDPHDDEVAAARALASALTSDRREDRVGVRNGTRYFARLGRATAGAERPAPYRVGIESRGSLDAIRIEQAAASRPQPGQVAIRTTVTALNFRDVLNVLGLYPGDPGPLGAECAGVVTEVGAGVDHVQPGDAVVAIAPGALASDVIADAHLVVRRPSALRDDECVTIPVAYVTAALALEGLARIRAGQSVLVHAAAGGVGMAAVHIARAAGATVFATAGSPAKRARVRAMGVEHVMSSRTPDFADEIARLTSGRGVDVVLNSIAGEMLDASFRAIADGGTFLEIGKNAIWSAERVAALGKNLTYHVIDWSADASDQAPRIGARLAAIMARVEHGELPVLPSRTFAIDDVGTAFRVMARGGHVGKLVIRHAGTRTLQVRDDRAYLITGGSSGLGLRTAEWLVEHGARHLLLIARREPGAEAASTIERLQSCGASVLVRTADVADRDAMAAVLRDARPDLPPFGGVVHAAGVLADGVLEKQTWARFAEVLSPKVRGTQVLRELARVEPLDFFVMYSSVAGTFGSSGQANHAAANAYEDAAAWAWRGEGVPATSIGWGAWADIGAGARHGVGPRAGLLGLDTMAPALALEALDRAMRQSAPHVVVTPVDWTVFAPGASARPTPFYARLVRQAGRRPAVDRSAPAGGALREMIAAAPVNRRAKVMLDHVRGEATRVLGLPASQPLDDRQPLHERGLDSLMAVELRNALGRSLECRLPATLLFDYPTPEALASHLLTVVVPESPKDVPVVEPPDVVSIVDELSDEEVDRLFAERMGKKA